MIAQMCEFRLEIFKPVHTNDLRKIRIQLVEPLDRKHPGCLATFRQHHLFVALAMRR
jgi:hypothetical protein